MKRLAVISVLLILCGCALTGSPLVAPDNACKTFMDYDVREELFLEVPNSAWTMKFMSDCDALCVMNNSAYVNVVGPGDNRIGPFKIQADYESDPQGVWVTFWKK